jgi:monoamine oxidase
MSKATIFDVAVIGAGASGLCAAQQLSAVGFSIAIIEARDRVGGRIHTLHDPLFPLPVELGAEFIHSRTGPVWPILAAGGGSAYLVDGDHFHLKNGQLRQDNQFWNEVGNVLDHLDKLSGRDVSFAEFLRTCCRGPKLARAKEMALSFIEGFDAAPADRISGKSIAQAEEGSDETEGSESFRIIGGYASVINQLRAVAQPEKVRLFLRTVVKVVRWKRGDVNLEMQTPEGEARDPIRARRAIVTLPIGVLRADSVKFSPDLSKQRNAWNQIEMGPVVKVIAKFREAFWETERLPTAPAKAKFNALCFMHSRETAFPTWWTWHPLRASVLTAWAGGPAAAKLSNRSREEILDAALTSLTQMTGLRRTHLDQLLEAVHIDDWQADPFSRGAYSYIAVGGINAPKILAKPINDTLYFAGEGTSTEGLGGTVDAALITGRRAAEQVLNSM